MRKKVLIGAPAAAILVASCGYVINNAQVNVTQEVREVSYEKDSNSEKFLEEFKSHEIIKTDEGTQFKAEMEFDMNLFEELQLVGVDTTKEKLLVKYDVKYLESDGTVLLSSSINSGDEILVVDEVPGITSYNKSGDLDVMFSVDDEIIWLSDINDDSMISNVGWFSNIFKSIVSKVVSIGNSYFPSVTSAISNILKVIAPIIRFGTKAVLNIVVMFSGKDKLADLGATVLNMYKDEKGIYHANFDCWQAAFGYTDIYDSFFDAGTSMRNAKFEIDIDDDGRDDYILWAWKGDYLNLGAGAELGIYTRWEYNDSIWTVDKNMAMKMSMKLDRSGTNIIDWRPTQKQWWITGFNHNEWNASRDSLSATYEIEFDNRMLYNSLARKYSGKLNGWDFSSYMKPKFSF